MEMVADAKIQIVHMVCDKCGKGIMERHGDISYMSNPILYPHKCNNCGYEYNYPMSYPYEKFIPMEPLREMRDGEE